MAEKPKSESPKEPKPPKPEGEMRFAEWLARKKPK